MYHEDPNGGPTHSSPASLPVVMPPKSPSSQPMVTPTPTHSQSEAMPPTNPSHQLATSPPPHGLPGMARPKLPFQPLEIPPRPIYQPGLRSPTPHSPSTMLSPALQPQPMVMSPSPRSQLEAMPSRPKPHFQPLEIPPRPSYQPEVMSPTPHSQSRAASPMPHSQAAAMSPKPQCPSPTQQRQPVAMSPTPHRQSVAMSPTSYHQTVAMSPTPDRQSMMMMPPPDYQPYMFPPPPYYHPGPPYNVPMMQTGFQAPNHYYPEHERAWSTDLFDCTKDIRNCSRTICCPCVTFGQIAEIVNEGTTPWYEPGILCALLAAAMPCFVICHSSFPYTGYYRTKLRKKYKLKGSVLEDCLVHCFCECCALCQEYRELDHQGFDVPLGWHENKKRERQAVAIFRFIPPEEQWMTR